MESEPLSDLYSITPFLHQAMGYRITLTKRKILWHDNSFQVSRVCLNVWRLSPFLLNEWDRLAVIGLYGFIRATSPMTRFFYS